MRRRRIVIVLLLGALLAGALVGRVATASSTVPNESLGYGSAATVTAYSISGVTYSLDPVTPQNIDQVAFTISPTNPRLVKAQLVSGGAWYACSNSSGNITCATTTPQATATGSTNLTIVATQ